MKPTAFIVALNFLIIFTGLPSAMAKDPPASADQLRGEVESALRAKDTNAFLALFNWQGVDKSTFELDPEEADIFKHAIATVKLAPLPADFQATNEVNGVRFKPNITIVGMIDVEFTEKGNSMQLPYGRRGNNFYLPNTLSERIATPATKAKSLNISVEGLATPDAGTVTGSYVYVKDGKEIKEAISGKGNISKAFWGDYVKSCVVQQTSDQGWIRLKIFEDGKVVFSSAIEKTKNPITYERTQ